MFRFSTQSAFLADGPSGRGRRKWGRGGKKGERDGEDPLLQRLPCKISLFSPILTSVSSDTSVKISTPFKIIVIVWKGLSCLWSFQRAKKQHKKATWWRHFSVLMNSSLGSYSAQPAFPCRVLRSMRAQSLNIQTRPNDKHKNKNRQRLRLKYMSEAGEVAKPLRMCTSLTEYLFWVPSIDGGSLQPLEILMASFSLCRYLTLMCNTPPPQYTHTHTLKNKNF